MAELYLLTPPVFTPALRDGLAAALDAAPVAAVQLRFKDMEESALARAVEMLRPVVQARGVACLLNDRPDLAMALGCDGAHVGGEDMPVADARRLLGADLQLGASCYASRDLAMQAGEAGADYVAFGAFFPSATKVARSRAEPALLAWWSELMALPCVAIGGITAANVEPLLAAGADFVAVTEAVWGHPDGPAAGARAMATALAGN